MTTKRAVFCLTDKRMFAFMTQLLVASVLPANRLTNCVLASKQNQHNLFVLSPVNRQHRSVLIHIHLQLLHQFEQCYRFLLGCWVQCTLYIFLEQDDSDAAGYLAEVFGGAFK